MIAKSIISMVVLFRVEGRQRHLHHLQLLVVLPLLLHSVLYVEQLHVVLPERRLAVIPQRRPPDRAEIVRLLAPAGHCVFVFEVEFLLVDQGVSLLHVFAGAWHLVLRKWGNTLLGDWLFLNLSSLAITPRGFFLSMSETGASVWQVPGPGGAILEVSISGFFSMRAPMLQCIPDIIPVFFWLAALSTVTLYDPGPTRCGECSLIISGRAHFERKTGLSFYTLLRTGQAVQSNFTTYWLYIYSSSGFCLRFSFFSLRIISSKKVRGDLLLNTDSCFAFSF